MKQIALLHPTAPPRIGQTENTIYHHARLLNQAGYAVRVISAVRDEAFYQVSYRHQVELASVDLLDPDHPQVRATIAVLSQGQVPAGFDALVEAITEKLSPLLMDVHTCFAYNTPVYESHLPLSAALAKLAQQKPSTGQFSMIAWCQKLVTAKATWPTTYPWRLLQSAWPGVRYIAADRAIQASLENRLGLKPAEIQVIPAGIEAAVFLKWGTQTRQTVESLGLLQAYPLMLLPTTIAPGRNIEAAIYTAAALLQDFPLTRLLVLQHPLSQSGLDEGYLASLQALCDNKGLGDCVNIWHPNQTDGLSTQLNRDALTDLYHLADLLILPDRSLASCSVALLEASLARLPIFAACSFPLGDQNGLPLDTFDPDDPAGLAKRIAAFMAQATTLKLRRQTLDRYTWQAILDNHLIPLIEQSAQN